MFGCGLSCEGSLAALRGEISEEDHELVATEPGDHLAGLQRGEQPPGDGLEKTVTELMAECIVQGFEVVEIEKEDCTEGLFPTGGCQGVLETTADQSAIGQPGELVIEGKPFGDDGFGAHGFPAFALDDVGLTIARDHGEHGRVEQVAELCAENDNELISREVPAQCREHAQQNGGGRPGDEETESARGRVEVDQSIKDQQREEPDEKDEEVELTGVTANGEDDPC